MKVRFSIRLLITAISLLLAENSSGCWFLNGPQDYRFWLLNPVVADNRELSPFYFSSFYFFNASQTIEEAESAHYKQNVAEWFRYLEGAAKQADIYDAQYKIGADSFFANKDELVSSNTFLKQLQKKRYREHWRYFCLAKKLEDLSTFDPRYNLIDRSISSDTLSFPLLIDEAEAMYVRSTDDFLKSRIAYQLIRLHLFNQSYDRGKKVYREMFLPTVNRTSWLYGAGIFFQALLTPAMGAADYYQLSLAFEVSTNKRAAAVRKFPTDSLNMVLPFAKSNHERANIYTMWALQYPGRCLQQLRHIYTIDPKNRDLPFLLMREVSKIEDWLKTPEYTNYTVDIPAVWSGDFQYQFGEGNIHRDSLYATELHLFIDSIVGNCQNKQVVQICAAQLCLLLGNPHDASLHLVMVTKLKLNSKQAYWVRIANLLCDVMREPVLSFSTEKNLLDVFETGVNNVYVIEPQLFSDQLKLFVANSLIHKGDTVRGIFLMARSNRCIGTLPINNIADAYTRLSEIGTPTVYDSMIALLEKKNKSPFEQYITQPVILNIPWMEEMHEISPLEMDGRRKWSKGMFLNLKATWFISRDQLADALCTFYNVPDSVWNIEPYRGYMTGNPFQPKDLPYYVAKITAEANPLKSFTRPQYLAELIQLKEQQNKQKGDERALICMKIAGAYYQMSYYGEYWIMNRIFWSSNDSPEKNSEFNSNYFGCSRAGYWYKEALKYAATEPVASAAAFMYRYCGKLQDRYAATVKADGEWADLKYYVSNRNPILEKRFKHHYHYDKMIDECH